MCTFHNSFQLKGKKKKYFLSSGGINLNLSLFFKLSNINPSFEDISPTQA